MNEVRGFTPNFLSKAGWWAGNVHRLIKVCACTALDKIKQNSFISLWTFFL
jgi:hypothetical protein